MSSHLFEEASAHLLATTPGRDWLEWMGVAVPLLADPTRPVDGQVTAGDRPGSGVEWDEGAVAAFAVG